MSEDRIREIALVPEDSRTDKDRELYRVYAYARNCVTGNMAKLAESLEMSSDEFYSRLDTELDFKNAVLQGLTDSRSERLMGLESALIQLAIGSTVKSVKRMVDETGKEVGKVVVEKEVSPNFQALQLLLDRYKGSAWSIVDRVDTPSDAVSREIDYSILSKEQLKRLAESGEDDEELNR